MFLQKSVRLLGAAVALVASLMLAPSVRAESWKVDESSSTVAFTAVGKPGFLRINGKGAKVTGTAASAAAGLGGTFETKLDDFVTGIDLRDEHMKTKYLETGKFPTATLAWTLDPAPKGGSSDATFKGKLKLHGIEKDLDGKSTTVLSSDGKSADVDATFTIKLSDFGIDIPSYLGVTVAENVDVTVHVRAAVTP